MPVSTGGTNWKPDVPIEVDIKESINAIIKDVGSATNKAMSLMLHLMGKQIFME